MVIARPWESLFAAHRGYLRRVIGLRMDDTLGVRVDPSDIVQEAQLEALRRVAAVRDAVARLGENDREIILLQAFEGLNSAESAQVLGIEPPAARKRFGRALLRLRELLIESGLGGSRA